MLQGDRRIRLFKAATWESRHILVEPHETEPRGKQLD